MAVVGEAVIAVRPNLSPFKKEVEAGAARAKVKPLKVDADTKGFRSKLGGLKTAVAALGGAFAAVKVASFFKDSVNAASDLNESLSKTRVVFGSSSKDVERFASDSAKSLGISRQAALESTSTFGNLLVALKLGKKPAADMSQSIVALGSDLASFNNVRPEDALEALRAGLVGETEPLRKFGVNLNDAALRQKALALGLVKTTKDVLPPAAKAQAAYALIMEQTKTAQGDFARTSDGLANQQRILGARFTDLKAKIGGALLPVVLKVVGAFNTFLDVLSSKGPPAIDMLKAKFGELTAFLAPFIAKLVEVGQRVLEMVPSFSEVVAFLDRFKFAIAAAVAVLAGMKVLSVVIELVKGFRLAMIGLNLAIAANPFVLVAIALAALAAAFVIAYQRSAEFRAVVQAALEGVKAAFAAVVAFVQGTVIPLWNQLWPQLQAQAQRLVAWFQSVAVPALRSAFSQIVTIVKVAITVIGAVIQKGIAVAKAAWAFFGGPLMTIVRGGIQAVVTIVRAQLTIVGQIIEGVLNLIHGRWGALWGNLKTIASTALRAVVSVIGTLGGAFLSAAAQLAGKVLTGLKNKLAEAPAAILSILARIPGALVGLQGAFFSAAISLGQKIVNGALQGVGSLASSLKSKIEQMARSALSNLSPFSPVEHGGLIYIGVPIVKGALKGVATLGPKLKAKLSEAVRDAVSSAKQNLSSLAGGLAGTLNQLLDAKLSNSGAGTDLAAAQQRQADLDFERQKAELNATITSADATADEKAKAQADLDVLLAQRAFDIEQRKTEVQKAENEKRLADLATALNRGLITQSQYQEQVKALLASQGADYKSAGDNLGLAFADGFLSQIKTMIAQSVAIARAGLPNLNELNGIVSPTATVQSELKDAKAALRQAQQDARSKSSAGGTKITAAEQKAIDAAKRNADMLQKILDAMLAAQVAKPISIISDPDGFVKALGLQVTAAAR